MDALHELWRARLSHLISGIRNNDPTHRELANAQALIEQDYKERFAIELVQNANDQTVRHWKTAPALPLRPGVVRIVWKDGLLAVLNQGLPFQPPGIRAVASLAVSDKADEDLVGNKGVGFKAVYQVTEQPEIYSGSDLRDGLRHSFTLPREWDAHPDHLAEILAVGEQVLREEGPDIAFDTLRRELLRSSPSRYPQRLPSSRLAERLAELGCDEQGFVTAIVLPLRPGVEQVVSDSLAKLHGDSSSLLFLSGVTRIEIEIDVDGRQERIDLSRTEPAGEEFQQLTTTRRAGDQVETTCWWLIRGEVTGLLKAAGELGLESWEEIDRAPVAVALPQPVRDGAPIRPLGKVCMGLPTDQDTGLPVWIDGHFHGFLNRDRISLDSEYNRLVFNGVLDLCRRLLDELRAGPLAWKRAAVLALERCEGLLADAAFSESGFGKGATVLGSDGETWLEPAASWMPNATDAEDPDVLALLVRHHPSPESIPDPLLVDLAPQVLASLGVKVAPPETWLQRGEGPSPLEAIAADLPGDDARWAALLDWAAATWSEEPEALADQSFLPVAGGRRLAPDEDVTLPRPKDSDGLPERVASRMRFLDDRALTLRGVGRALTPMAKRLTRLEWVDQPRLDKLLEVLAAALAEVVAADEPSTLDEALELWGVAMAWLSDPNLDATRVKRLPLLVPVGSTESPEWISAERAYLGKGWVDIDAQHEARLESAYARQRLIPWIRVADRWPDADREAWVAALAVFGVDVLPRTRRFKLKQAPLDCSWGKLVLAWKGPFQDPALDKPWQEYLRWLVGNVDTHWSYSRDHHVDPVVWLDGLERDDAVQPVLELALLNPTALPSLTCSVYGEGGRHHGRNTRSFWLHHLRERAQFPSRGHHLPASDLWHVPSSEEGRFWTEPVRAIDRRFARSSELLRALGVHTPEDAPATRLIVGLHALARRLEADPEFGRTRGAQSLAIRLYEQLADRSRAPEAPLAKLGAAPIPLVAGRGLVPVDLRAGGAFVLIRDDDQKARLVTGEHFELPYPRRSPPQHFVDRLVAALGRSRVKRASQVSVDTGFTARRDSEPLVPWLKHLEPRVDVELHLAALLTFALPRRTQEVPSAAFTESLARARVRTGHFVGTGLRAFFDAVAGELQLESIEIGSVIPELWRVVGRAYMDVLMGYAAKLRHDPDDYVMDRCGMSRLDLTNLEEGLGRLGVQQHAGVLVVARARAREESIEEAADAWQPVSGMQSLLDWLGLDDQPEWLTVLRDRGLPHGVLGALRTLGASVDDWQAARLAVGREKYHFQAAIKAWVDARGAMAAAIKLACARDSSRNLAADARALEEFGNTACPEHISEQPEAEGVDAALRSVSDGLDLPPPSSLSGADHYRDAGEAERSRLADRFVELRLAEAAEKCPDQDRAEIEGDQRLGELRKGPWAHWRVALHRLGVLLKEAGWPAYAEMQRANAFIVPPKEPTPSPEEDPVDDGPPPPTKPVDLPPPNPPRDEPPAPPPPKPKKPGGEGPGPKTPSPRTTQRIGDRGELFFCEQLRAVYAEQGRELDPAVWVSTARRRVGGLPGGDDNLGYDFQVRDLGGRIAGRGDSLLWVEVKTTTRDERRFAMSEPEWAQAKHCAAGATGATYVIVRIQDDGKSGLRVMDIVVDPVAQLAKRHLRKDPKDHWITLGEPAVRSGEE